jgi:hypothetical protein
VGVALVAVLLGSCTSDPAAPEPTIQSPPVKTIPKTHPVRDPYPALCRLIAVPDAQRLFRKPLGQMTTGGGSDCQFAPRGSFSDADTLKVYLRRGDGDKTLFNHIGDIGYGRFTPLTGLGYQAKWASQRFIPITVVDVRKGSFTCTVIPPQNEAVTTLAHPGRATDQPVPRPIATAFARAVGTLCSDIFSAR